jgi:hypothetical protein
MWFWFFWTWAKEVMYFLLMPPLISMHSISDALRCSFFVRNIKSEEVCWQSLQQRFDCQNLGFVRSIQQVSSTFLILIKFHELCWHFLLVGTQIWE